MLTQLQPIEYQEDLAVTFKGEEFPCLVTYTHNTAEVTKCLVNFYENFRAALEPEHIYIVQAHLEAHLMAVDEQRKLDRAIDALENRHDRG